LLPRYDLCFNFVGSTFGKMVSQIPLLVILPVAKLARVVADVLVPLHVVLQFINARKFPAAHFTSEVS
jgi:hypothetical protein